MKTESVMGHQEAMKTGCALCDERRPGLHQHLGRAATFDAGGDAKRAVFIAKYLAVPVVTMVDADGTCRDIEVK